MIAKTFKYLLLLTLAFMPVIAILAYMATSPAPAYPPKFYQQPSQTILANPAVTNGQSVTAIIDEAELNLLINEFIKTGLGLKNYSTSSLLQPPLVNSNITIALPYFDKRYVNVSIALKPDGNRATIEQATIGQIDIPLQLANVVTDMAIDLLKRHQLYPVIENIRNKITDTDVAQGFLRIDYNPGLSSENQTVFATNNDVQLYLALIEQYAANSNISAMRLRYQGYPLNQILTTLFSAAEIRVTNGESLMKEHAAIIIALSLHCADQRVLQATNWLSVYQQPTTRLPIGIHNKSDLAEHFVSSAAVYYYAGEEVALLIGLYKEMLDARVKEEFGLGDLTADYAGIEFAKLMTQSNAASWLAQNYQLTYDENNLLPVMTAENINKLKDISLLGRAGINTTTIEDIKSAINATIKVSPLYSASF
jgi:hypothetical protein